MNETEGDDLVEALLREARLSGAVEAEVYRKSARGRRVALEPALLAAGRPRLTVSVSEEEGITLRVKDARGRWGFAWKSPAGRGDPRSLAAEALAACRPPPPADLLGGSGWSAACALPHDQGGGVAGRAQDGSALPSNLEIDDPEVTGAGVDRLADILAEGCEAARSIAAGAAEVDRSLLSAAGTSVTLANSLGFRGTYRKSLALLSIAMVPAAAGARAVLEERSACRLRDLGARECGREAALRALPARPAVPPPHDDLPLILGPRAAASLLVSLLPWILDGGREQGGPHHRTERGSQSCRLSVVDDARLPAGFGSAPFDGVGRPTRRTTLVAGGTRAGRLSSLGGNVVRPSFRDAPAVGPANLHILPASEVGELLADPLVDPIGERLADQVRVDAGPCLRVTAARFIPGPAWRVRVLKGEWHREDGTPAGAADGVAWKGPLEAILGGITAAGSDLRFVHLGLPLGAPSLRIEGLRPWYVEGTRARDSVFLKRPARVGPAEPTGS